MKRLPPSTFLGPYPDVIGPPLKGGVIAKTDMDEHKRSRLMHNNLNNRFMLSTPFHN